VIQSVVGEICSEYEMLGFLRTTPPPSVSITPHQFGELGLDINDTDHGHEVFVLHSEFPMSGFIVLMWEDVSSHTSTSCKFTFKPWMAPVGPGVRWSTTVRATGGSTGDYPWLTSGAE
jgi:hypothetical protein